MEGTVGEKLCARLMGTVATSGHLTVFCCGCPYMMLADTPTYKISTIHHSSPKFIAPFQ